LGGLSTGGIRFVKKSGADVSESEAGESGDRAKAARIGSEIDATHLNNPIISVVKLAYLDDWHGFIGIFKAISGMNLE